MSASQAELSRIRANPELATLYLPPTNDKDVSKAGYGTPFHRPFKPVLWHSGTPIKLESAGTSESSDKKFITIKFQIPSGVSMEGNKAKIRFYANRYLYTTSAKLSYPGIKVKPDFVDKVRIRWCQDHAIHYAHRSEFKINEKVYCTVVPSSIDEYYSWNRTDDIETFNEYMLNLPHMLEWTNELKPDVAEYIIPHFYSYSQASSFPLFLVEENMKVFQEFTYPKDVAGHLLQVQIFDGEKWEFVKFEDAKALLEIDSYSLPILLCDIEDVSPEQAEQDRNENEITIPIQRFITIQQPNTTKSGIADVIPINGIDPVVAIFAKSKNEEAVKYNDLGNCVDVLEETTRSKASTSSIMMKYGQVEKFSYDETDVRANRMLRFFKSIPYRRGRYAHAFSIDPFNPVKLAGMVPDSELKCALTCQMAGKKVEKPLGEKMEEEKDVISAILARNRSQTSEKEENENTNNYRPEVNLLVHSDLVFTKNENGTYDIKLQ